MSIRPNIGLVFDVKPMFDSATAEQAIQAVDAIQQREDASLVEHTRTLGLSVLMALLKIISEGEYDDDELATDVLDSLLLEATEDEEENSEVLYQLVEGAFIDGLTSLNVDETTVNDIGSDDIDIADTAIHSAVEIALSNLPDDGEPLDSFVRDFVFGESDSEEYAEFDSMNRPKAQNGKTTVRKVGGRKIAYRGTLAVRHGKKVVVNKRIGNQKLRLSAKQKGALKKARFKAFSANAMRKRINSFKKGIKMDLYK